MPCGDIVWVFLVGCLTGALGIGASLALPALFALGMPAATALLAFKLPLAVADLAAASCYARCAAMPRAPFGAQLALTAAAGACGTCLLLTSASPVPCVLIVGILLLGVRARRAAGQWQLIALGAWMGVCGLGAGLALVALGRHRYGDTLREAVGRARALGAAANFAAVAVVALCTTVPWEEVLMLTLALALGSGVGSTLSAKFQTHWTTLRWPAATTGRGCLLASGAADPATVPALLSGVRRASP